MKFLLHQLICIICQKKKQVPSLNLLDALYTSLPALVLPSHVDLLFCNTTFHSSSNLAVVTCEKIVLMGNMELVHGDSSEKADNNPETYTP